MPDNHIDTPDNTPRTGSEQEGRGLLKAWVEPDVFSEVRKAFEEFGFPTIADGVRLLCKGFARDSGVREALRSALPIAYPDTPASVEER